MSAEAEIAENPAKVPIPDHLSLMRSERDGYEVHAAALRRGCDLTLFPRQVMEAASQGGGSRLAFVHGIPNMSTLSAVTFAQDQRMRRAVLMRTGLPVPLGATFTIGTGVSAARRYASRLGYPVVVKPAVGDNTVEVFPGIADEERFDEVIDYLRTAPEERAQFVRSAYALTQLQEPGEVDGKVTVPPSYRFLVEQHVEGEYVRVSVISGAAEGAILAPSAVRARLDSVASRDVTDVLHPDLRQLAERAVAALPGLAVAAVDLVVTDHRKGLSDQDARVVELSERPWLAGFAKVSENLSGRLAEAILVDHAAALGIELGIHMDQVKVDWTAHRVNDAGLACGVIAEASRALGIAGDMYAADPRQGLISGVLEGEPRAIAQLSELLIAGRLGRHRAMLVTERPCEG